MTTPETPAPAEKARVQINYKSGISMVIECDECTVKRSHGGGVGSIELDNAQPRPLLFGVEDIESVWELP